MFVINHTIYKNEKILFSLGVGLQYSKFDLVGGRGYECLTRVCYARSFASGGCHALRPLRKHHEPSAGSAPHALWATL